MTQYICDLCGKPIKIPATRYKVQQLEAVEWLDAINLDVHDECVKKLLHHPKEEITEVETNMYDKEEIYPNCTVQILTNTLTGEVSVGWWKNDSKLQ